MSALIIKGNTSGAGSLTLQSANTSSTTTLTLPATDGSPNQAITTDGSGNLTFSSVVVTSSANTFTAAQTFRAANAVRSEAASTQDAVVVAGRAGGTSSYAVTLTPDTLTASRTATLPDSGGNYTLGYINAPQSTNTTLALTDQGKHIYFSGGSTATLTVPTNASVAFPIGTTILVVNDNSGNLTISGAGVTFQLANGATGNRTVATKGLATCLKVATDTWYVSGAGVT